ncbi:MAG TPA: DUF4340 domain-containing protein, partial [Chryseosolibacter sp.]
MLASEIQERRNKRSLITLTLLVIVTVATAFLIKRSDRPPVDKTVFKTIDFEAVDKIRIENSRDTIELSFVNSRWLVNNEYAADRNLVTLFFATLKQAEPKREINLSGADSIARSFEQPGSKVMLYSGANLVQTFLASGNNTKTQSFFKDPASGKVYLMTIPGYRVYVSGIFELNEGGWRDKMLFGSFNWRNFQSLEMQFPEKPGENFKVQAEGAGLFGVVGVKTDTAKLNTFLDDVSLLVVDEYPESAKLRDSLTQVKPFLNLIVRDIANSNHTLRVFRENQHRVLGLWMDNQVVLFDPQRVRN